MAGLLLNLLINFIGNINVVSMRATKSLAQLYGKMDIEELVKYVVCKNMRQADIKTVVVNCKCSSNNPLFVALKNIAK